MGTKSKFGVLVCYLERSYYHILSCCLERRLAFAEVRGAGAPSAPLDVSAWCSRRSAEGAAAEFTAVVRIISPNIDESLRSGILQNFADIAPKSISFPVNVDGLPELREMPEVNASC